MPHRTEPAVAIEEDEVERKAHAEGVDAAAAWNQEPGARLVEVEMGEAEQAGTSGRGDGHLASENGRRGKIA
jgi:hypothetical protein